MLECPNLEQNRATLNVWPPEFALKLQFAHADMLWNAPRMVSAGFNCKPATSEAMNKCSWTGSFFVYSSSKIGPMSSWLWGKACTTLWEQSEFQGELLVRALFPPNSVDFLKYIKPLCFLVCWKTAWLIFLMYIQRNALLGCTSLSIFPSLPDVFCSFSEDALHQTLKWRDAWNKMALSVCEISSWTPVWNGDFNTWLCRLLPATWISDLYSQGVET